MRPDPTAGRLRRGYDPPIIRVGDVVVIFLVQNLVKYAERAFVQDEEVDGFGFALPDNGTKWRERDRLTP